MTAQELGTLLDDEPAGREVQVMDTRGQLWVIAHVDTSADGPIVLWLDGPAGPESKTRRGSSCSWEPSDPP